ncbi:hypothetical protein ACWCSD_31905 [Nonomuraea sp. NPDC001684]
MSIDKLPANPRIQVRVDDTTAEWLADRATRMHSESTNIQAKTELGMWRDALAYEVRRIRLTLNHALCLADVLNGHVITPGLGYRPGIVYAECYDAFHLADEGSPVPGYSTYGKKWDIDERAFLEYLGKLSPIADHALLDAINRWWALQSEEPDLDDAEAFTRVGLRLIEEPTTEAPTTA